MDEELLRHLHLQHRKDHAPIHQWQQCSSAHVSPFHHYIGHLAQRGRAVSQYSQNVDCIKDELSSLSTAGKAQARSGKSNSPRTQTKGPWPSTIHLHGRQDIMRCYKFSASFCTDRRALARPKPSIAFYRSLLVWYRTEGGEESAHDRCVMSVEFKISESC